MNRGALISIIRERQSFLCVGLDPDIDRMPAHMRSGENPLFDFNKAIIDATRGHCVAYKPNTAFYECHGSRGWNALEQTVQYIGKDHLIIADAKRGDIGNTSRKYAQTFFESMHCDAITVAPYMGSDSVQPFTVHTSAATVIVLPEAEEFDVEVKESDLRVDSYCSSGPGGQSVNTTYSAIRLTHKPSGIVAQCQDQKSKLKNYEKALAVLRTRIYEKELEKKLEADMKIRKTMVSTGDRSAKIRTYNYSQGRVTDHRINLTLYNLSGVMDGDISEILGALQIAENAEKLKESVTQ